MLDQIIKHHSEGVTIAVRVTPNASRNALVFDEERGQIVVRLSAPPVEGRSNTELVRYLGKLTGFSRSSFRIIKGASAREKVVLISGADPSEVRSRLEDALGRK